MLTPEARGIVHHLKYQGYESLATLMAAWIAKSVSRPASATIIPIPMARRRARVRGFNQAELIARALGAEWKLPVVVGALRRIHGIHSQTDLTPREREINVRGAFLGSDRPRTARALVVDDVLTTGATVVAAASALANAGWSLIEAVTFARALPFQTRVIHS